ncbi:hypothetical protein VOLCADRAFT_90349 [Volvox carteri f. nagariensis]|uniref:serine O-acetyltransferase n=1 Tax=Volvox carteri f. nagariensis TaxID=3068 RepID=D8TU50_VOLCA|nr:uncharacterized protein VOLCADRAFT_90349 [Volvox carteri f. nagariensis]EFJ48979.1 hypothetical protein VOLCADRAFT_90349 [Volvox carteri f. nagariensis]|eukprot:XP_002949876.1 hypothetical protein VOLCADRAFT_90349 [Volvox carteri f. nagariensis]
MIMWKTAGFSNSASSSSRSQALVSHRHMPCVFKGWCAAVASRKPAHHRLFGNIIRRTMARDRLTEQAHEDLDAVRVRLNHQLKLIITPSVTGDRAPNLHKANDCQCDREYHPSKGWRRQPHHLAKEDLWTRIQEEAQQDAFAEPALASNLYSTILSHHNIEATMAFLLANKLSSPTMLGMQLMRLIQEVYEDDPEVMEACLADLQAVYDRDPACDRYTQAILYFKGFQAVQSYRIAHWLWQKGRKALALAIQSRMSEAFHVDIHPAAEIGRGIMIDHATGVVIGETAVVGDNVSMLHHVTLGGSGTGRGVRHPTIGHGVLLGAGVSVLGPVMVGAGSKVGAGSVVVSDIPCHSVAVGVPARIIKRDLLREAVKDMDQCVEFVLDYEI